MLYKNIVHLCKEKGISIAKLERETGLGNGTIGKWEKASPNVDNAKKVANFFGKTLDELVGDTGETEVVAG